MLLVRLHWHNAFQQAPYREARLLAFASGGPGAPSNDPGATYGGAPLNPDGTAPVPEAIQSTEHPTQAINDDQNATRAAVSDVLQDSNTTAPENSPGGQHAEAIVLRPVDIADKLTAMRRQIQNVRDMRKNRKDVMKYIKSLPENDQKVIFDSVHLIDAQWETLLLLEQRARGLSDWKNSKMTPNEFRTFLARSFKDDEHLTSILTSFDTAVRAPEIADLVARWNRSQLEQHSDKQLVVQTIWNGIGGDNLMAEQRAYLEQWNTQVENVEKAFLAVKQPLDNHAQEVEEQQKLQRQSEGTNLLQSIRDMRRNGIMGIGFYTIDEYVTATKKVWQSYQEGKREFHEQQANKLAATIGHAVKAARLPYSDVVDRRLTSILESEFNKQKNEFKDELGDDSFKDLRSKLQDVKNDPPKAIAVLEVAASHGYLYEITDLDEEQKNPIIFGVAYRSVVPPHWDENQINNYLSTLTRSNSSGQNEEREKGKNRINKQQNKDAYTKYFKKYLDGHNYWSAIGVAEAFIERGKNPEASEILTVTLIEHLRHNPDGRKYMTKSVLEQFGNMHWGEATFSQNMITMNMDTLNEFKANGSMNGSLLGTIKLIQEELAAADPLLSNPSPGTPNHERLTELTARVLSSKTVTLNGKVISIFREKYRQYWDEKHNSAFREYLGSQALKTSNDYYTDSGLLLLPEISMQAIFATGSTGTFDNPEIAFHTAGAAIVRMQELDNPGGDVEAANIYRTLMKEKLTKAFQTAFTRSATEHLHNYEWKTKDGKSGKMISDLIRNGLLDKDDIFKFAEGKSKEKEFKAAIEKQLATPTVRMPRAA